MEGLCIHCGRFNAPCGSISCEDCRQKQDKGSPGAEEVLECGRAQEARPSPTDGDGVVAPSTEWNEAEHGRITWLSSGEDEGPDCGIVLGLGDGWSLHVGEFADATLRECGVDLAETSAPSGWWSAIGGPDGFQIIGPVSDHEAARAMIDRAFAAIQSTPPSGTPTPPSDGEGGAQRSEAEPTEHKASASISAREAQAEPEAVIADLRHFGGSALFRDTQEGATMRQAAALLSQRPAPEGFVPKCTHPNCSCSAKCTLWGSV